MCKDYSFGGGVDYKECKCQKHIGCAMKELQLRSKLGVKPWRQNEGRAMQ